MSLGPCDSLSRARKICLGLGVCVTWSLSRARKICLGLVCVCVTWSRARSGNAPWRALVPSTQNIFWEQINVSSSQRLVSSTQNMFWVNLGLLNNFNNKHLKLISTPCRPLSRARKMGACKICVGLGHGQWSPPSTQNMHGQCQ